MDNRRRALQGEIATPGAGVGNAAWSVVGGPGCTDRSECCILLPVVLNCDFHRQRE